MDITFKQAYDDYIDYKKLNGKPQSLRSVSSRLRNYVLPYFQDLKVTELNTRKYLEWQISINENNFSYKYKKALHYTVVGLLNYCIKFYDLDIENTASKVGNFKNLNHEKPKNDFWTYREFIKFIHESKEFTYQMLYKFLFFSGCRLGEVLALKFKNIIENYEYVHVGHTISKEYINGERVITSPKTKDSIRNIRLTRVLRKVIKRLKKYYIKKHGYFDDNWFIFGATKPLSPTTIERKKNEVCKKARVKQIRMHDFRHSLATLLYSKGVPIKTISKMLGHADETTTMTVYIHTMPNDEKKIVHTLDFLDFFLVRIVLNIF